MKALLPFGVGAASDLYEDGEVCVTRPAGVSYPTVFVGAYTGGAHCCFVVEAVSMSGSRLAAPVSEDLGNSVAHVELSGNIPLIITSDDTFDYQFESYAASGVPIVVQRYAGNTFQNETLSYPSLIAKDATTWWSLWEKGKASAGLGALAAWAADECHLGKQASADEVLHMLESKGELGGGPGSPWQSGSKYLKELEGFLVKHGYCRG
jgi:hypothetical protein